MPSKRQTYLLASALLGALFFDLLYDIMEISFQNALSSGTRNGILDAERVLFGSPLLEIVFVSAGLWTGLSAGKYWWRIIYIEDRRHRKYKLDW